MENKEIFNLPTKNIYSKFKTRGVNTFTKNLYETYNNRIQNEFNGSFENFIQQSKNDLDLYFIAIYLVYGGETINNTNYLNKTEETKYNIVKYLYKTRKLNKIIQIINSAGIDKNDLNYFANIVGGAKVYFEQETANKQETIDKDFNDLKDTKDKTKQKQEELRGIEEHYDSIENDIKLLEEQIELLKEKKEIIITPTIQTKKAEEETFQDLTTSKMVKVKQKQDVFVNDNTYTTAYSTSISNEEQVKHSIYEYYNKKIKSIEDLVNNYKKIRKLNEDQIQKIDEQIEFGINKEATEISQLQDKIKSINGLLNQNRFNIYEKEYLRLKLLQTERELILNTKDNLIGLLNELITRNQNWIDENKKQFEEKTEGIQNEINDLQQNFDKILKETEQTLNEFKDILDFISGFDINSIGDNRVENAIKDDYKQHIYNKVEITQNYLIKYNEELYKLKFSIQDSYKNFENKIKYVKGKPYLNGMPVDPNCVFINNSSKPIENSFEKASEELDNILDKKEKYEFGRTSTHAYLTPINSKKSSKGNYYVFRNTETKKTYSIEISINNEVCGWEYDEDPKKHHNERRIRYIDAESTEFTKILKDITGLENIFITTNQHGKVVSKEIVDIIKKKSQTKTIKK